MMRSGCRTALLLLSLLVPVWAHAQEEARSGVNPSYFPSAAPEDVGMSSERLQAAMAQVEEWVEESRIMGGILIVVRHGQLVFHEAVGINDRERGTELQRDDILLMRSMTKPLTGTAILMLMEEGKLSLDDRVAKYLPGWDGEDTFEITICQLLTHTSGITGGISFAHDSLLESVAAKGRAGVTYEPGSRYHYSDANSAALAAIVGVASGMPEDRFVRERILEPLGMRDSYLVALPRDDPRHARTAAGYRGDSRSGEWRQYRDVDSDPLTPFWGGSGGLYATGLDYARFLWMMMNGGEFEGERVLSPETVELAIEPHTHAVFGSSVRLAMTRLYGLHWYSWTDEHGIHPWPVSPGSFGHGGAEGTYSWADPQERLIVLYLTQSNGNDTRPHMPRLIYDAILD
jgi:CubicO group peptidase (beta-lactamase class C family)